MNLRCLLIGFGKAPMMPEVGKLTSLNTLNVYPVSRKRGHEIGQLKNLELLRGTLMIPGLENVRDKAEAVEARLKDKKYLVELYLEWPRDSFEVDDERGSEVLDGLEPPPNLNNLNIWRYSGVVSPSWLLSDQRCLSNLQILGLYDCSKWKELPPLGQLPSLVTLELRNAKAVEDVGPNFYYTRGGNSRVLFPNLKSLLFRGMENWTRWSLPSCGIEGVQLFPCLSKLFVINCPKLTGIPFLPPSLCILYISDCPDLKMELSPPFFPPHLKNLLLVNSKGTETLISEMMSSSSSLESLYLENCSTPDVMLLTCPSSMTSVTEIKVRDCESLTSLVLADHMKALLTLRITGCKSLRSIEGIGSLPSLETLYIVGCPMLVMSLEPVVYHVCCKSVTIIGCANLSFGRRSVGEVHCRSSITSLGIDDPLVFEKMSQHLTSLSKLTIWYCNLSSLPVNLLSNLSSMKKLGMSSCSELESLPNLPTSLEKLELRYYENIQSLPVNLLSSLKVLKISSCDGVESLPDLGNLSFLEKLKILFCPKFESLPNLPASLAELIVWRCHPNLQAKYKRGGPLHQQIAHIPKLLIDVFE